MVESEVIYIFVVYYVMQPNSLRIKFSAGPLERLKKIGFKSQELLRGHEICVTYPNERVFHNGGQRAMN